MIPWAISLWRTGDSQETRRYAEVRQHGGPEDIQSTVDRINGVLVALSRAEPLVARRLIKRGRREAMAAKVLNVRLIVLADCFLVGQVAVSVAAQRHDPRALKMAERSRAILRAAPSVHTLAMSLSIEAGIVSIRRDDDATRRVLRALCHAAEASGCVLLLAVARQELSLLEGDAELGRKAAEFLAESGITDPIYAARVMLPGVFHINGTR